MIIRAYNEDCAIALKNLRSGSVDLTVTSPPYDNLRSYGGMDVWNFPKFQAVAQELYRVTADGGVVVWIVGDATINGSETGTSFKQALYFKEVGFNLHDTMIWEKPTFTATGSLRVRYGPVFEYMFVLSKGKPKTFNPIRDRPNCCAGDVKHGTVRQKDGSVKPISSKGKQIPTMGQRFNVWHMSPCKSPRERLHPAPFPVQLAKDHIISWSNEGDTVLDPFMGSGTTGVACMECNRDFVGIEINSEYFKVAQSRMEVSQ